MENDEQNSELIDINILDFDSIFKIDYINQDFNKNENFINWKNSMEKKFGPNIKLFKCNYDRILFYRTQEEYKKYPVCQSSCPLCKKPICFYCHRYSDDNYGNGTCCLRRKIYCFFSKMV